MKVMRMKAGAAVVLVVAGAVAYARPSFQGLGYLSDGRASGARDVSADGSTVVGWRIKVGGGSEAFRWTQAEGMTGLGPLPGHTFPSVRGNGVSADGSVVVGASPSTGGEEAFRWSKGVGMEGLGRLPGGTKSEAYGVSADGSVVVGYSLSANGTEAFRWTREGGMESLGVLPGADTTRSEAWGVSADGSVVVGFSQSTSGTEAFRWTQEEGMVGLGDLPGGTAFSEAFGISSDGSVVVGMSHSGIGYEAFRWTEAEGMVGLGLLPGGSVQCAAMDVSADGSIVVGTSSGWSAAAFIWDAVHGMRDLKDVLITEFGLDLTGWQLTQARGISDDGATIVGYGVNPDGRDEAWIAVIPEPSSLTLLTVGVAAFLSGRRRRI